jgi:hypothetical protein
MAIRKILTRAIDSTASSSNLNIDANTLFIDTTNNRVGIGSASPASKLVINGESGVVSLNVTNASVDGSTADVVQIQPSNGAYYGKLLKITSGRSDYSDSLLFLNTSTGMNGTNGSYLRVQNSSSADIFRIKGDGTVGIGTGSPATKLDVNSGSANSIITITTNSFDGTYRSALNFQVNSFEANPSAQISCIGTNNYSGDLVFSTAFSGTTNALGERMRLKSSGNVGIGISDPQDKLHVEGTLRLSGTNAQALYIYGAATIKPYVTINEYGVNNYYLGAGSTTAGVFSINATLASSGGIHIKATNQYVGIGTTTPGRVLDVNGDTTLGGNAYCTGSIYLGASTGAVGGTVYLANSPDSHAAATAGSTIRLGGSAYLGVTWYRWNSSFNAGYLSFGTHIGGIFAGERCQLDVYGNFQPSNDGGGQIGTASFRWGAIYSSNGTIQTSDLREKTEIVNSSLGLNFIKSLRPVSYKWKVGGIDVRTDFDAGKNEKGDYTQIVTDIAGKRTHFGLIAQEVKEVLGEQDFGGYVYDTETDRYALRYDQFVSPLIKAVQELSQQVTQLTQRIAELENK